MSNEGGKDDKWTNRKLYNKTEKVLNSKTNEIGLIKTLRTEQVLQ